MEITVFAGTKGGFQLVLLAETRKRPEAVKRLIALRVLSNARRSNRFRIGKRTGTLIFVASVKGFSFFRID